MTSSFLPSFVKPQAFIDGEWCSDSAQFPVINPANSDVLCHVSDTSHTDIERAIVAAERAQKEWAQKPVHDRAIILNAWRHLILDHKDELARLMTMEQGKPIAEARAEIGDADSIRWSVEESYRTYGKIVPHTRSNLHAEITYEPVGVVVAITPWNFPHSMITRKVAPALAAGCGVVLKPAEDTPLSALALASLAHMAGVPSGLFNVVPCSRVRVKEVGEFLTTHPIVRKVSFTGSTAVGKTIMANCASTVKNISLELGGNAPFIIFESAHIDRAIDGVMASKFRNAGQTCICANRVYVARKIYDVVISRLKEKIAEMKVGDGLNPSTKLGPLINQSAMQKIDEFLRDARDKSAVISTGPTMPDLGHGFFRAPCLIERITPDMRISQDEIFGPLLAVYPFDTESEVIEAANNTQYGLAAYIYTEDEAQARRVSKNLQYGMVGCNTALLADAGLPFGGRKESGIGREGGPESLLEFMETKFTLHG